MTKFADIETPGTPFRTMREAVAVAREALVGMPEAYRTRVRLAFALGLIAGGDMADVVPIVAESERESIAAMAAADGLADAEAMGRAAYEAVLALALVDMYDAETTGSIAA